MSELTQCYHEDTGYFYRKAEVDAALLAAREERDRMDEAFQAEILRANRAEASLSRLRELLARALDEMERMTFALDQEFRCAGDPPDVEQEQFVSDIKQALAQTEKP